MSDSSSESSSSEGEEDKKKKKKKKAKKEKDKKSKKSKKKKDKKKEKDKGKKKEYPTKMFSKTAQERARLEAQHRGMGIAKTKESKKKKKKKGSSSSSSSSDSNERLKRMRLQVENNTFLKERELQTGEKKVVETEPEKPYDEMTWPERAAAAAIKAEADAIWRGASKNEAAAAAEEAGESVMKRALQFGYVEPQKRAKFDAAKGVQKKLSPVEQARSAGLHAVAFASGNGPTFRGGGVFGMSMPKMSGGMEGGYMG